MNKIDASHFQAQARQDRGKLIAGVAVMALLSPALILIGASAGSMALALGVLAPVAAAALACAGFFGLRVVKKMERDNFDEGMHVVMESAPMVCSLYDKDNNIKYCNDAAPKLFGYRDRQEYSENYASSFPDFQPDGSRSDDMAAKVINDVISTGSASVNWYQKAADGELLPLSLIMVRTFFQGEDHMLEFTKDKRIELEVERKREDAVKERMKVLLDASPMLCMIADESGNIVNVNKEAENLFGIPDRQMFINNFNSFVPERQPDGTNSLQKGANMMREAIRTGRSRYDFTYRLNDGTLIPAKEIANHVRIDDKDFAIVYTSDMRAEYAAREAEQLAQKRLQTMTDRLNGQLESQSAAINESSAAIEEMIANTRSVSSTLSKNAQNVQDLQEASAVGHSGLNEVATDIREIARESESLLEINAVMQNIASQTNLLSMNAAIEAAHAGESGRGFAVVADEIRKLAESSSKQSKTIGAVLKKIKGSIDKITKSTDNVMNKFEAIDGGVKTVAEQEQGIANAMAEQSAGSAQIMQAIAQVNDITGQVKEDARQMVEAAAKLGV